MKIHDNFLINMANLKYNLKQVNKKAVNTAIKIAQYNQSFAPEDIKKHMDTFFSSQQNQNPNEPNFAVDTRKKRKPIPSPRRNAIQKILSELGRNSHNEVPIDQVFAALEANNVVALQEDGTKWAGFISTCGECGTENGGKPVIMELAVKTETGYEPANVWLTMTLCTLGSGRIEFVGYLA